MLTIHHLGKSQSERIVWLCEELGLDYALQIYHRDPILSPPALRALTPIGAAPVLEDGAVLLAESTAIVEYILARYGQGRLQIPAHDPAFPDYLYWLHFANGTLQPAIGRRMIIGRTGLPADHPVVAAVQERQDRALAHLESRLTQSPYLAGETFTAADIMTLFSLTTMRYFQPFDLTPAIRAYIARIAPRPAYRRAMAKGDPGMPLLLD